MAPEFSPLVRRVTFLLVALSAVAVETAATDGRSVFKSLALAAIWVSVVIIIARLVPVPSNPRGTPPMWMALFLGGLAAAPFAIEPLRRHWTGDGHPLEVHMVCGLRNVGLGLAACGGWLICQRLACVVSLFLTLFAVAMTSHPVVMAILALYTAAGSVWLMLVYWSGLKSVFVTSDKVVAVQSQEGRDRLPWALVALLVLAVCGGLTLAFVGPRRAVIVLGEWMPTSGGTGETDPFARSGVGDGPEETSGDNARSAGMVESEKMIEDNKDSLIDAVNDTYGPPHKTPKERELMVAAGKVDMIQNHSKLPDNRRPSREFTTSRKGPKNARKPGSQSARGLFEVSGRTPLHIRVVGYERYDAVENRWLEAGKPGTKFIEPDKAARSFFSTRGEWMRLGNLKDCALYLVDERHQLKTADMKDNLVPTPALLTRFRIDKVDRPDYFDWNYEGVLVLAGRKKTPPGVIVTTECRTLDRGRLPESAFALPSPPSPLSGGEGRGVRAGTYPSLCEVPASLRPDLERIARAWAGDKPRGWPQIEAILTKLRTEYTLDGNRSAPPEHAAPVIWFLIESRQGPDYLFATVAALLLRTLDYQTRFCLGYYAAPDAYDAETSHTPVTASDLHFWPEVRLKDGHWLVVEPTPGYDVLGPNLPLSERIMNGLTVFAGWIWQHLVELSILLAGMSVTWLWRREIIDAIGVWRWIWFPGRTWREQVRKAVHVLERRGQWAGKSRRPRQTFFSWLRGTVQKDADLDRLTRMAEWAAYAPQEPPWSQVEVLLVCRRVLAGWTLKRWQGVNTEPHAGS